MRIGVASDHAGFRFKTLVAQHLRGLGHEVQDFGAPSEEPVDYPDFVFPPRACRCRRKARARVRVRRSGNGEAMTANRCPGVRCAVAWDLESARLTCHNDANVLSLGQRLVPENQVLAIVIDLWLATAFEGGRHVARIRKLDEPS
jgi:ribose 5-phosphate isomerase B